MGFTTRPGASPVLAALVASGFLARDDALLDVGCGKGADAVALAKWGFLDVTGLDADAIELAAARARAQRAGARVEIVKGDALALPDVFPAKRFDVALDTLFSNNLRDEELPRYVDGLARVLARSGRVVVTQRVHATSRESHALPREWAKRFRMTTPRRTHLPEERQRRAPRDWAHVVVSVGTRR